MGYGGGGNGAAASRAIEAQRQFKINQGLADIDKQFAGFNDDFYNRRAGEFEAYQLPQLNRQYDETKNNLAYSLARSGLLGSSVAASKGASLEREMGQKRREISDAAMDQSNQLRRDVEGQRSNLVAQLESSGDPAAAAQMALRASETYKQPMSFRPIGNAFADWTDIYLANRNARANDPNVQPLFNWGGGSSSQRIFRG